MSDIKISRVWAMPNKNTFDCKPIGEFVKKYLNNSKISSVDPFAGNKLWADYTNDLNPESPAGYHMQASEFCGVLYNMGITCDLAIFDPPYSPEQISRSYKNIGLEVTKEDTQNGRLYKEVRDGIDKILTDEGVVLSFGWNSCGMGKGRGYKIVEILLVCHGGAHNDTICMAETRTER